MSHPVDKVYLLTENNQIYLNALQNKTREPLNITSSRSDATIVLADPPLVADCLGDFPRLKWLQSTFAGVDKLMADDLRRDYQLTNIKGIFGPLIAEYVFGYLTRYYRHFEQYDLQQKAGEWLPQEYRSLVGMRMVILGTGVIGTHLAKVAKCFGLQVSGVNSSGRNPADSHFDDVVSTSDLTSVLSDADIIVSTLPNTPQTRHILNHQTLKCCSGVLLFNVGRGMNIDDAALVSAIEVGCVKQAFLDVFVREPLAKDHPFWQNPAITITPHIAAVSFPQQVATIFVDNYNRWCAGDELMYQVDFSKGY